MNTALASTKAPAQNRLACLMMAWISCLISLSGLSGSGLQRVRGTVAAFPSHVDDAACNCADAILCCGKCDPVLPLLAHAASRSIQTQR